MKPKSRNDREIREILAPCGLDCGRCLSYVAGEIGRHSRELRRLLGNFEGFAERFSALRPEFKGYPQFKALLELLASPACRGCRSGDCLNPGCAIAPCSRGKKADYCFLCAEFPCAKPAGDPHRHQRWLKMNGRMKEIGVAAYYEETRDLPRYG